MFTQPVPVYSQYMSMSPDSSAARTVSVPVSPVWSAASAPAAWSAAMVIWPRSTDSVNSLDPTVTDVPAKS
jgi:hypothetical protein